ncbi:MAG: copper amine oxidase N-terminal domain-containing protein [Candidatus Saccharibacteria bacterium]
MHKTGLLVLIGLLLTLTPMTRASVTESRSITIKIGSPMIIDGRSANANSAPFISNQRAYAQLLPLTRAMNIPRQKVFWDADNRAVVVTTEGNDLVFTVGDRDEETSLGTVVMDVAPLDINGHVAVPVRYAAQALGYSVEWSAKDRVVSIIK